MKCPTCGSTAQGKFCAECGSPLEALRCPKCQAKLEASAAFCTQCGTRVAGKSAPGKLGWYVAGVVMVGLLLVLLVPTLRNPEGSGTTPPFAAPGSGTPPPLSANMRENADRLFNRVMQARESGDSASVKQFAPMAIMAYQNSGPLDADGLYHLSTLETAAGDPAAGRATAEQILNDTPTHLLALSAAANASAALGDRPAASNYYQRFLDSLESERGKPLPEYQDHGQILPALEAEARAYLQQ